MEDFFRMCGCTSGRMEIPDDITDEACKKQLAEFSKGLAHPARVEIVRMLANMPPDAQCICGDIVNALPLAQSSVSQHLKTLKETGWVQGEIDGPRVCYCITGGVLEYYLALIQKFIQKEE
jgi:DNA-binding transcriptional ArsR family regulator